MTAIVPDAGSVRLPGGGGGIVPDQGSIQVPEQTGALESVGRGALQGVSLGFSDEIAGALEYAFTGKPYAQARDESRAANQAASESHPYLYGGAELAAGLVTPIPGLGAAKAGAGLAVHAGRAALAGGVAGLGSSEADLTKGDFHGAINDTVSNALLGGAIGLAGGAASKALGKAAGKADDQAIRALAGAESKTSGAAWQKTRRMVNNPETKNILREPVQVEGGKTTTLESAAGKEPGVIQEIVDTQTGHINDEIRPIYEKADAKNGGVSLKDYLGHLDDRLKATADMAPSEARVYRGAIDELKTNALEQWGQRSPELLQALESQEAKTPAVRDAIMKQFDVRIPSDEVRAEATALQKIGFKTVDPLNPGLHTQVKRDMGNMVRDFVNEHVMKTLGGEDHSRLLSLNKRMNAWLGVGTVAAARAEKEAAGRMSLGGHASNLLGHGGALGALAMAAHGNVPGAVASYLLPKAIERAPSAIRGATRTAAKVDTRLKAVADAAAAGNPFAQKLLASIQGAPGGAARLAALQGGQPQPGVAPAPAPEMPTEVGPDALIAQR